MASPYFDDCQKLFITPSQASSYVNPLYDEKATTDSESIKSLAERIANFAEESKRLHEERLRRLEENLKVWKLNHPELKTPQPETLEVTSTSMPPSHSKSAKTNTSNSPLTPGRHKPTQVQTCQPSINEGPSDGQQKANAATQKPTLWPASIHKSDKPCLRSVRGNHAFLMVEAFQVQLWTMAEDCATMASPYFDDCQKLFITPPKASSYVNPLYDEKATTDSKSIKSLAERIVDFVEESNRLHEERLRRMEENLKVCKLNLPELKTPQPKSEVLMEDSKKCHATASPGTLKQFCKSQNVTEMPIVNEGQTILRSKSNPMITVGGHESQLQRAVQSQQRHAALEATSTSMPPSHSKSAKTNTSNSPLTPGRHKPTQVQICQPSINEGPSDGRQKVDAATQKPTLWPASIHKSDKVSTSSISTSFETNEHISSALLKKCSRRPCFLDGRSPSKFNYGQWLKVKYPFKVVSLKRGVISNLGGQPSQIEQQRLQDLIANEVHKAIEKKVARFVPLQPDANSSIQSMPPQQKHVCKPSPPQQFADSLPKATQEAYRPPCCPTCRRPYSKNNDSFQSGFHKKFSDFPCSHKDNMGGDIRNTMPSHLPSRRKRKKSKDLCWTPMKEQKQQTHVSEWRHGGHDLVEKHGGMCKCCLYKQRLFEGGFKRKELKSVGDMLPRCMLPNGNNLRGSKGLSGWRRRNTVQLLKRQIKI
ncbi:hypothetical protein SLEP1_g32526 [Rubroshorea leprosula]|uniref:Uncharacterized protein n=1 Tax=Rubroshorea leprosula TaxID=152421 RepID=A0AAV5KDP8_9ROSI|nr:hypothetical protein SLEP1_g32526 [Rubroshorea leprosula]